MKKFILPISLFLITATLTHIATLSAIPSVIMNKAISTMKERGIPLHQFVLSPRTTPQTQTVVRPSPDLAYSICRFDFSELDAPLKISVRHWQDYASISFFDAKTNNFETVSVGYAPQDIIGERPMTTILLFSPDTDEIPDFGTAQHRIKSPSHRGLILIRRLAPTVQAYEQVRNLAASDICQPYFD